MKLRTVILISLILVEEFFCNWMVIPKVYPEASGYMVLGSRVIFTCDPESFLLKKGWRVIKDDGITAYFSPNSIVSDPIEWVKIREEALKKIERVLKYRFDSIVVFFVFNSNEESKVIISPPLLGFAVPPKRWIFTKYNQSPGHELCHVVAYWWVKGRTVPLAMINEGLATYLDMSGNNYHRIAKFILSKKLEEPTNVKRFVSNRDFRRSPWGYPIAASFVGYLIEKYGIEKFRKYFGFERTFIEVYGKTIGDMIDEWLKWLFESDFGELSGRERKYIEVIEYYLRNGFHQILEKSLPGF